MNYSKILEELNDASLSDLYRLDRRSRSLEDPVRIKRVKDSLRVGQEIEYSILNKTGDRSND